MIRVPRKSVRGKRGKYDVNAECGTENFRRCAGYSAPNGISSTLNGKSES